MPAPLAPTTPLGDAIRSCRLDAGYTQAGLAEALNVRQATVSTWEGGEFLPKPIQVLALARLIGLDRDLYWEAVHEANGGDTRTRWSWHMPLDLRRPLPQTPPTALV